MRVRIPYYISNNGDGSASLVLCRTRKEAKQRDENQSEGWGESSARELELTIKDGKLMYEVDILDEDGWPEGEETVTIDLK